MAEEIPETIKMHEKIIEFRARAMELVVLGRSRGNFSGFFVNDGYVRKTGVEIVQTHERELLLEFVALPNVIGVQHRDVVTGASVDSNRCCLCSALIVRIDDEGNRVGVAVDNVKTLIVTCVINHDDFTGAVSLRENRVDRLTDEFRVVVRGNDHRNLCFANGDDYSDRANKCLNHVTSEKDLSAMKKIGWRYDNKNSCGPRYNRDCP